jgi:hypothetical protein
MLMDITDEGKPLPNPSKIKPQRLKTQFQCTLLDVILNEFHPRPLSSNITLSFSSVFKFSR